MEKGNVMFTSGGFKEMGKCSGCFWKPETEQPFMLHLT